MRRVGFVALQHVGSYQIGIGLCLLHRQADSLPPGKLSIVVLIVFRKWLNVVCKGETGVRFLAWVAG